MARVKIKHPKLTPEVKTKVRKVLSQNLTYATCIIEAHDRLTVLTKGDEDLDRMFQAKCVKSKR